MLDCHEATRLMSDAQERPLSLMERLSLKFHLAMCKGCTNFNAQMGIVRKMARDYAKDPHTPKE